MAQRFGGKYSPDSTGAPEEGRPAFDGARVDPVGARSNLLFLPPVLLAFTSLTAGAAGLAAGLSGAAVLTLGAWLLRDGLRAEAEFNTRRVARRPAIPRKILAAACAGLGAALAAFKTDPGLVAPLIYGVAAGALHVGAFGIDPLKNKGMEGIDTFQQDRVARVVDEAEKYLAAMTDAVKRAGDRQIEARVERFQVRAKELLRTVEEDPRDLTAARKFLGVYLMGARDATIKFADVYARTRDAQARTDYMMLLTDLEESFGAKTKKLLLDTNSDLNVEIEVLRDRLQREGVRLS
ncbi:5-bromo-4-chloroindolyl phosphate hydrolysis family protein [Puniceibacterium confluentis]|uniref:5-bromo-4-chloroindolyl phosphate hydrolysis family protein n=1 Tax=Puniceibacterium confluentis TaxID=1958944 RepID=UPI0011B536B7|nr:5-bromo-4-chloroindolyl phosphate hydrolysis family protein [Puniceibacterium confluentis]